MALIPDALRRLEASWSAPTRPTSVRVNLRKRVVFDTVTPSGMPVVVKASLIEEQLTKERLVLERASDAGLPVPAVVAFLHGSSAVLVLTLLRGTPLSATSLDSIWSITGDLLRRLHALSARPGIPTFDSRDGDWASFMTMWARDAADRAHGHSLISRSEADRLRTDFADSFLEMPCPRRVVLHGDCQPEHVLTDAKEVAGIIDFGDVRIGDPAWDLAVLTMDDLDRVAVVLDGYGPDAQLRDHMLRWAPAYRLLRQLGCVCWSFENGLHHSGQLDVLKPPTQNARSATAGRPVGC